MPFDLKRITKEFGDLITNKKCLAYYGFEINKLESMAGHASGASLNDMQKFVKTQRYFFRISSYIYSY